MKNISSLNDVLVKIINRYLRAIATQGAANPTNAIPTKINSIFLCSTYLNAIFIATIRVIIEKITLKIPCRFSAKVNGILKHLKT